MGARREVVAAATEHYRSAKRAEKGHMLDAGGQDSGPIHTRESYWIMSHRWERVTLVAYALWSLTTPRGSQAIETV
jgi:hypothetical protein